MKSELKEIVKRLKVSNFDSPKNKCYTLCKYALMNVYIAIATAEELGLTDEKCFQDFNEALLKEYLKHGKLN